MSSPNLPSGSPLLDHCPPSLPAPAYYSQDWFDREQRDLWKKTWLYAGRTSEFAAGTLSRVELAQEILIVASDLEGR
ncbi:MAG: hypothetical protein ACPG40_10995, partial [Alphaproteobacteria bacterium]